MPPDLDIYVLTKQRDLPTINRFLDTFVDRSASEERGDEELMIVPLGLSSDKVAWNEWLWEPALTLTHTIERGLEHPRRAFLIYLQPKSNSIDHAWLGFTTDDQLVLGVSVDDEGELPENQRRARELLSELIEQFGASVGIIAVEEPPPLSQEAFDHQENKQLTLHFWRQHPL